MHILYLSRSSSGKPHPFVQEQVQALVGNFNIHVKHHLIERGGLTGYLKTITQLIKHLKYNKTDIIHVHYGLWGLAAIISRALTLTKIPVIITFHGSDINKSTERQLSLLAHRFSAYNIIVSDKMQKYFKKDFAVLPCGIDTDVELIHRERTRVEKGWSENDFVVLFASNFKRKEKDPEFAFNVIENFSRQTDKKVKFIELAGYTRDELTCLMQAADTLLLCSEREGSPQVLKEAILNSLPIVANDVGDVKSICADTDNCFIVPKKVEAYTKILLFLSQNPLRIQHRDNVLNRFDNKIISQRLYDIYKQVLDSN